MQKNHFTKCNIFFTEKFFNNLGTERIYLNIIKAIKNKFIANIILNGESFKVFPLRPGIRYMCLISPILFNIVLQVLVRVVTKD